MNQKPHVDTWTIDTIDHQHVCRTIDSSSSQTKCDSKIHLSEAFVNKVYVNRTFIRVVLHVIRTLNSAKVWSFSTRGFQGNVHQFQRRKRSPFQLSGAINQNFAAPNNVLSSK